MALQELVFNGPIHDFHSLEVRRRKNSADHSDFTLSNPDQRKSERADGILILEWGRKPDKVLSMVGVELFSEFEAPGAYWMAYKLNSGCRFHLEEIERFSLEQEAATLRHYCLPDPEKWLWTYSLPESVITVAKLTSALSSHLENEIWRIA